jgi:hypothetical protein
MWNVRDDACKGLDLSHLSLTFVGDLVGDFVGLIVGRVLGVSSDAHSYDESNSMTCLLKQILPNV